jgi:RNA polymerase-interacting CarD/CdnL/TRCF family regulator
MALMVVGEKVVYAGRGPCLISAVVQKVVCGTSVRFYRLALLDGSKAELFVPVDKSRDLHYIRTLLDRSDIPALLGHLERRPGANAEEAATKNWRQRQLDNSKLLTSGSTFELADAVGALTYLSGTKTLGPVESDTLYRARKLLVCEIAEVMNESKLAAEARIDHVLQIPAKRPLINATPVRKRL